jgi:hypothetical protein
MQPACSEALNAFYTLPLGHCQRAGMTGRAARPPARGAGGQGRAWQAAAGGCGQLDAARSQGGGEPQRARVAAVQAQQARRGSGRRVVVAQLQQHLREPLRHQRVARAAAQAALERRPRQAPLPQLCRLRSTQHLSISAALP